MIALASDFDGTIYFGEKQGFYQSDLDAIIAFQNAGNLFGICTGRPLVGIEPVMKGKIDLDFYILSSGAVVLDKHQNILYKKCLSREVFNEIYKTYHQDVEIGIQANQKMYAFHQLKMPMEQIIISSPDDIKGDDIFCLSIDGKNEENAAKICQDITTRFGDVVDSYQNIEYIDIVAKGCSKGEAIKKYKAIQGIDVIGGIGDSYNDLPMLDNVDQAFSFFRSPSIVQESADHLVYSVRDALMIFMNER
ncbi:HAD-IIB family hydrolase [Longibaculum muris]|uniref:HAD-IIB family hydrolase n=1 Tax=Longibaculum muris TaxID=1796628 RepID=UPI0022DF2EC9|nr:HAD-IIB family hydrolase [Longibaculum muris]